MRSCWVSKLTRGRAIDALTLPLKSLQARISKGENFYIGSKSSINSRKSNNVLNRLTAVHSRTSQKLTPHQTENFFHDT